MMDRPKCIVCNKEDVRNIVRNIGKYRSELELFMNREIYGCAGCQLAWVHRGPSDVDLMLYYRNEYGHRRDHFPPPDIYFSDVKNMFKPDRSQTQMELLKKHCGPKRDFNRVLDIGAAFGNTFVFLRELLSKRAEMYAVEPDEVVHGYLDYLGVNYFDNLEEVKALDFDLIVASNVLEHFRLPRVLDTLQWIVNALRPGGLLLVEVPQDNFFRFPELVGMNHTPHLTFFSREALHKLLRKFGLNLLFSSAYGTPIRRDIWFSKHLFVNRVLRLFKSKKKSIYGRTFNTLRVLSKKI